MLSKQKILLWLVSTIICMVIIDLNAGWEKTGTAHYEYKLQSELNGTKTGDLVSYKLSLSPPKGEFITPSTFSNCTKDNDSASNVSGKKIFDPRDASASDYAFSMRGNLKITGLSGGGDITWSTSPKLKEPFWVDPKTQMQIGDNPSVVISASKTAQWTGIDENKKDIRIRVKGDKTGTADLFVKNGSGVVTASAVDKSGSDQAQYFICKHGEWMPTNNNFEFSLDPALKGKLERAINAIPKVSVSLDSLSASYKTEKRVFCCENKEIKEQIKSTKQFSLGTEIGNSITIWGLPTQKFLAGNTKFGFEFNLEAGLRLQPGGISFAISQEVETSPCENMGDCIKTSLSGSWTPTVNLGIDSILCIRVFGLEGCGNIVADGSFNTSVTANMTHYTEACNTEAFSGQVNLGGGTVTIRAELDGAKWSKDFFVFEPMELL